MISVIDTLERDNGRLDVKLLGVIPIARKARTPALMRGELMRYLAELPWAPDAILANPALRWRVEASDCLVVGAGHGNHAVEVTLTLDSEGNVATVFAPDRPRSAVEPLLLTPWRGRFFDYRRHLGRSLPFAAEVAWEIDGKQELYWKARVERWKTGDA